MISKIKAVKNITDERAEISLKNWYVNWISLYRRRFALITNSKTLFNVLVYYGTKKEISNFESIFTIILKDQVNSQIGINLDWNKKINLNIENSKFVKTNSQSVLAHMREFKFQTEYFVLDINNMEYELLFLMNRINEMPIGTMNYRTPKEILRATLNMT